MQNTFEVLYVNADGRAAREGGRHAALCLPGSDASRASASELATDAIDCGDYAGIVVDGASLGPKAVETVQQLRWLGFGGPVVLTGCGRTDLDRVLAREAGASFVLDGPVSSERLARFIAASVEGAAPIPSDHDRIVM